MAFETAKFVTLFDDEKLYCIPYFQVKVVVFDLAGKKARIETDGGETYVGELCEGSVREFASGPSGGFQFACVNSAPRQERQ